MRLGSDGSDRGTGLDDVAATGCGAGSSRVMRESGQYSCCLRFKGCLHRGGSIKEYSRKGPAEGVPNWAGTGVKKSEEET